MGKEKGEREKQETLIPSKRWEGGRKKNGKGPPLNTRKDEKGW